MGPGFRMNHWVLMVLLGLFTFVVGGLESKLALILYDSGVYNLQNRRSASPEVRKMLDGLESKYGLELVFKEYSDEDLTLFNGDVALYRDLVLLPSSKKYSGNKSLFGEKQMVDFMEQEGNILVVSSSSTTLPKEVSVFLNEIGIYPSPKGYAYTDYFDADPKNPQLGSENLCSQKVVTELPNKIKYHGGAALLSNNENVFPVLRGSKTSVTKVADDEVVTSGNTWTFGEQGFPAVSFQALNNARLSWVGSESLLFPELIEWTLNKRNVLALNFLQHFRNDRPDKINTTIYKVNDQMIYMVGVSEFVNGKWIPYEVKDKEDQLQLEFTMLNPYVRLNMLPLGPTVSSENASENDMFIYYSNFTIPDQYGVFTLNLDYRRYGLSYLSDKTVVTVRHLANYEYKRSWTITNSWLYIVSAILVVLAWLAFVVNFLNIGHVDTTKKKE